MHPNIHTNAPSKKTKTKNSCMQTHTHTHTNIHGQTQHTHTHTLANTHKPKAAPYLKNTSDGDAARVRTNPHVLPGTVLGGAEGSGSKGHELCLRDLQALAPVQQQEVAQHVADEACLPPVAVKPRLLWNCSNLL